MYGPIPQRQTLIDKTCKGSSTVAIPFFPRSKANDSCNMQEGLEQRQTIVALRAPKTDKAHQPRNEQLGSKKRPRQRTKERNTKADLLRSFSEATFSSMICTNVTTSSFSIHNAQPRLQNNIEAEVAYQCGMFQPRKPFIRAVS